MFLSAFSGFSVDDLDKAREFYETTLGLELTDDSMGLTFKLPGGSGSVFIYPKPDHQPATYTTLNFVVTDIGKVVDELISKGVTFEHYDSGDLATDEKGIAWGKRENMGPNIAWFKDPAGNTVSVLEN